MEQYLQYGVQSQLGVYYENPTQFPAVSFCDVNPLISHESTTFYDEINARYINTTAVGSVNSAICSKFRSEFWYPVFLGLSDVFWVLVWVVGSRFSSEYLGLSFRSDFLVPS